MLIRIVFDNHDNLSIDLKGSEYLAMEKCFKIRGVMYLKGALIDFSKVCRILTEDESPC